MISEEVLRTAGFCFVAIAAVAVGAWLLLGAWSAVSARRLAARRGSALASLAAALHGEETGPALEDLERLSREGRISVLIEMAFTVAGDQRRALDRIAPTAGVLDDARRWATARRWHRRLRAARLFGFFGDGSLAEAERLLDDRDPDVRSEAAIWAGEHPTPERARRLVEMLGDREARCRFRAQEALVQMGQLAIPSIVDALAAPVGPGTVPTLQTARRLAVPDFLGPALALTGHSDAEVRVAAAALAAAVGGVGSGEALDRLLGDPDAAVRRTAARGLGHLARWQSAAGLDGLLDDSAWKVRHEAALALRRAGPTGELLLRRRARREPAPATSTARSALELEPFELEANGERTA